MTRDDSFESASRQAVSVILVTDARVLLVKRARQPARGLHAFPGGRVEAGETPEAAALRELREETGLIGRSPRPFRDYDLVERDEAGKITSHFALTVFLADLDPASPPNPVAGDDAAAADWYSKTETVSLAMPESVRECLDDIFRPCEGADAEPTA